MVFLYLRGNAGVYYMFGEESGADDLIDALGGIDVAGELGWEGMRPMTDEALIAADPDLIITMTGGLESTGGIEGLLQEKPAVALTAAGQHERIVDMDDGTVLSFGPRSADVIEALARAVYAPDGAALGTVSE
jgi:iron complex transport system substrate-binding protein